MIKTPAHSRLKSGVKNNNEILRPGMFANIQIELKEDEALLVPAIAVLKQEGTNNRYIFLNKTELPEKCRFKSETGTMINLKL